MGHNADAFDCRKPVRAQVPHQRHLEHGTALFGRHMTLVFVSIDSKVLVPRYGYLHWIYLSHTRRQTEAYRYRQRVL